MIKLPSPAYESHFDLNKALQDRRSIRDYSDEPLSLAEVSQLLWASQGVTSLGGFRTSPSAGALYPLEVYVVAGKVEGLEPGIYKYDPHKHQLEKKADGDRRAPLAEASLGQQWMARAPAMIAFAAVYDRTTERYGERGSRYVFMEAGHASENLWLEAVAMKLGTVAVAAFSDADVKKHIGLPKDEQPLYLMPVGRK
jgi:SagB-type dehydrogenase family enzyme